MKAIFTFIGLLLVFAISAQTRVLHLKFPPDTYTSNTPQSSRSIAYTATNILPAIDIFTSDGDKSTKLRVNQKDKMGRGKKSFLIAFPKLYESSISGATKTYKFGKNGGENNFDDATVKISYSDRTKNTSNGNDQAIMIKVTNNEILTINKNSTGSGSTGDRQFLEVEASNSSTATIQINRQPEQGNVIICVFNSRNGKLLGMLNPKDPNSLGSPISLVVATDVYVIPVIRPKTSVIGNITRVVFEVGDPENNGTVDIEEEE